jgi:hypothetical protein
MALSQDQMENLLLAIPAVRLKSYAGKPNDDLHKMLSRYVWNTQLCESLYPSLHYFEICLRNCVNTLVVNAKGTQTWFDQGWLGPVDQHKITDAITKISGNGKQPIPTRVISELSLGFWVNLFSNYYERELWQKGDPLKKVFPNAPRAERSLVGISKRLVRIKDFRNRVFHHEPIINRDFNAEYEIIMSTILWMNQTVLQVTKGISNFPLVAEFKIALHPE